MVDRKFGTMFNVTGYLKQNNTDSFVLLKPLEKLEFIEKFAFQDIDLSSIKSRNKALIKERNDKLISITSKLETLMDILGDKEEPDKVKFPMKHNGNVDETASKILSKNDKCITQLEKLKTKLDSFSQKFMDKKILNNTIKLQTEEIETISLQLEEKQLKIEEINQKENSEELITLKSQLNSIILSRDLVQLRKTYKNDKQKFETIQKKERDDLEEKIRKIEANLWDETDKNETKSMVKDYKTYLSDMEQYEDIVKKLDNIQLKEEQDIESLEDEINDCCSLLEKLKLQASLLTCPSCKTHLKITNTNELIEVGSVKEKGNINKTKETLNELKTKKKKVSQENSENSKNNQRYSILQEKLDNINEGYEEIKSSTSIRKELKSLESYYQENKQMERKLEKYKSTLENNILTTSLIELKRGLDKTNKKIISLENKIEEIPNENLKEEEIRNEIIQLENENQEYVRLNKKIQTLLDNKNKREDVILKKESEYKDKYKDKTHSVEELEEMVSDISDKIKDLEIKCKKLGEIIKKIEQYKKYQQDRREIEDLEDQIKTFEYEEKNIRDKLTSANILKESISKTESIAILSIINSINSHVQIYLDSFFVDNPITVTLQSFKEDKKKNKKPQINMVVDYKGMTCDTGMLSGGELQRVILAYTLALSEMFNTPIVLLDECTSNLDQELTSALVKGVKDNYKGSLVVLIAHQVVLGMFDNVINL